MIWGWGKSRNKFGGASPGKKFRKAFARKKIHFRLFFPPPRSSMFDPLKNVFEFY